ncbi:hypothetical protein C7271_06585 [filamentous cyanobacterium CCP5]|nr:hypothetical protein C7271_06585 [filamentous cyanobacterium CCP5]
MVFTEAKSMEKTRALMDSIELAENHTAQIEDRVEYVDRELEEARRDLAKTKEVYENLDNLSTALEIASSLLASVTVVPSIGVAASALKKTIDLTRYPVDKATDAARFLESISKEMRAKIYQVEEKVEKVDQKLLSLLNTQNDFLTVLGDAQSCIDSLPASASIRAELVEQIETVSATLNPIVRNLDSAQKSFLEQIIYVENKIKKVDEELNRLFQIDDAVKRVRRELQPMINTLEDIKRALKKTISVPYGITPKICKGRWGIPYPCGKPIYYRFTVWQILTGPGKLIKPVMDLFNREVDKILRPLLRKLNLNINLDGLPGAEELEALRNRLEAVLNDAINDFARLLTELDGPMGEFSQEMLEAISKMKEINDRCHLNLEDNL